MRLVLFLAALVGVAVLAGCATLSEAECQAGDWRSIGLNDGANGRSAAYIDNHISACGEFGIAVDRQLYEAGRIEGLRAFCRLDNAAARGRLGESYDSVCPGELGVAFRIVYDEAHDIYEVNQLLLRARTQLDQALVRVTDPATPAEQLPPVRLEILRLQTEITRLENQLRREEDQLFQALTTQRARLDRLGIAA